MIIDIIHLNQLRLKLLYKNIRAKKILNIILSAHINKIKSYHDTQILENLLFLEFLSSLKAIVKSHKKNYQSLDVQLQSFIRINYINFFMNIMKLFYVPLLKRRGGRLNYAFDQSKNTFFRLEHIKHLPLIPETFLRYNNTMFVSFYLKSLSRSESLLLLNYYSGFK
jgi:hypothetical protein